MERLGSAILLERQDENSGFGCRMYSSRYMVREKFLSQSPSYEIADQKDRSGNRLNLLPFGTYDLPLMVASQPQALVTGTLILETGCIHLMSEGQRYALLFPAQFTDYLPVHQVFFILGHSVTLGTEIKTNGGYFSASDLSKMKLIDQVPEGCVTDQIVMIGTEAWQ